MPSLGTREVVAVGEGLPLPARLIFKALPEDRVPRSETFERKEFETGDGREREFVRAVVDRWRAALGGGGGAAQEPPANAAPPILAGPPPQRVPEPESAPGYAKDASVANRLEQLRSQILKRNVGGSGLRT